MRVLAFRHGPSEGLGLIKNVLDASGIACQYIDLYHAPKAPIPDAEALILLGGSMSTNDNLPFIKREIEHIRASIRMRKPVLGICLGAQLISKALGAKVYLNASKEIGWATVTFTEAGRNDPLFRGCESEIVFHWHGETFDLPEGADLLGSSAACRHQAFRFGDRLYGFQFHLEVTPEMILEWCREDAGQTAGSIDPFAHAARSAELARTVFGRWCDLVKTKVEPHGDSQREDSAVSS